jgi:high-affinity nickel-transport protein
LGVRHAFDADHIAAIDDSSRLLVGRGERPYSLGLFFALGHSSVVFVLCIGAGLAGGLLAAPQMRSLQEAGGNFAALAAAMFLLIVGLMNLRVFLRPESGAPSGIMHSLFGNSFGCGSAAVTTPRRGG